MKWTAEVHSPYFQVSGTVSKNVSEQDDALTDGFSHQESSDSDVDGFQGKFGPLDEVSYRVHLQELYVAGRGTLIEHAA